MAEQNTSQGKLVEKAEESKNLKSAVTSPAKGMEGKTGEERQAYRSQRRMC